MHEVWLAVWKFALKLDLIMIQKYKLKPKIGHNCSVLGQFKSNGTLKQGIQLLSLIKYHRTVMCCI